MDETYVRIRGRWAYLYRAVDAAGKTVDFRLSPRRNVASVKAFFRKAVRLQGRSPKTITLDGYAASHRAVRELQQQGRLDALVKLRSSKYLNNLIEQDHRNVKSRLGPMPPYKKKPDCANSRVFLCPRYFSNVQSALGAAAFALISTFDLALIAST